MGGKAEVGGSRGEHSTVRAMNKARARLRTALRRANPAAGIAAVEYRGGPVRIVFFSPSESPLLLYRNSGLSDGLLIFKGFLEICARPAKVTRVVCLGPSRTRPTKTRRIESVFENLE
jgi:hypothetical protein